MDNIHLASRENIKDIAEIMRKDLHSINYIKPFKKYNFAKNENSEWLVYESKSKLLGVMQISHYNYDNYTTIDELAINNDCDKKSIESELIEEAKKIALSHGSENLFVDPKTNFNPMEFYKELKFEYCGSFGNGISGTHDHFECHLK